MFTTLVTRKRTDDEQRHKVRTKSMENEAKSIPQIGENQNLLSGDPVSQKTGNRTDDHAHNGHQSGHRRGHRQVRTNRQRVFCHKRNGHHARDAVKQGDTQQQHEFPSP